MHKCTIQNTKMKKQKINKQNIKKLLIKLKTGNSDLMINAGSSARAPTSTTIIMKSNDEWVGK